MKASKRLARRARYRGWHMRFNLGILIARCALVTSWGYAKWFVTWEDGRVSECYIRCQAALAA